MHDVRTDKIDLVSMAGPGPIMTLAHHAGNAIRQRLRMTASTEDADAGQGPRLGCEAEG